MPGRIHFILTACFLGLSCLPLAIAAENDPSATGIETSDKDQSLVVETSAQDQQEASVQPLFQYVPIPDPKEESGKDQARKAFKAFIRDNRNAGLLVPFLKSFDLTSLRLLKNTILRSDSHFWAEMKAIGATRKALEEARQKLWKEHEKNYASAFENLKKLQESLGPLPPSEEVDSEIIGLNTKLEEPKKRQLKEFRLTLESIEKELDMNFLGLKSSRYATLLGWIRDKLRDVSGTEDTLEIVSLKNIIIIEQDGSETKRNLFEELESRMAYVIRFAHSAEKHSPEKYGLAYVLSWVFTEKNLDLAIEELGEEQGDGGEETPPTTPPENDDSSWSAEKIEVFNALAQALSARTDFMIGGESKQGPLASAFIRMRDFHEAEVAGTQENVLGAFKTHLNQEILADSAFQHYGGETYNEATRLAAQYEKLAATVEQLQSRRQTTAQTLAAFLERFAPGTTVGDLNSKESFKAVMEKIALKGATREEAAAFTSALRNYTQLNLHLAFSVNEAAQIFIKVRELHKSFQETHANERKKFVAWIQGFDQDRPQADKSRVVEPTYGAVLKNLVDFIKEAYPSKLSLVNTPLTPAASGNCLSFLPPESHTELEIGADVDSSSFITGVEEALESTAQKRLFCFATYEWALKARAQENEGADFVFSLANDPENEFDVKMDSVFRFMGEGKSSVREPQNHDHSIFEGFYELIEFVKDFQVKMIAHLRREFKKQNIDLEDAGAKIERTEHNTVAFKIPASILFDQGKAALKEDGQAVIERYVPTLLSVLGNNKILIQELSIEGHTNSDPYPGYVSADTSRTGNEGLSDDRALAVFKHWNETAGSNPELISFVDFQKETEIQVQSQGQGAAQPILGENDQEDKVASRRVVLKFRLDTAAIAALKNDPDQLREIKKKLNTSESTEEEGQEPETPPEAEAPQERETQP